MEPPARNDIPKDTNGRASHFAPLQPDDVASLPQGMYSRAMLRAYAESLGVPATVDEPVPVPPVSKIDEPGQPQIPSELNSVSPIVPSADTTTVAPFQPLPVLPRRQTGHSRRFVLVATATVALGAGALGYGLWREASRQPPLEPIPDRRTDIVLTAPPVASAAVPPAATIPVRQSRSGVAAARTREAPARPARASSVAVRAPRTLPPRPSSTDGALVVTSDPPGARVTVNGIGWGVTPVTIPYLPFGTKQIRLIKPGYESAERTLTLGTDRPRQTLRVQLRSRGGTKAPGDHQE